MINTSVLYVRNHDFFSTNTLIRQNFAQSEKIIIKNKGYLNLALKINYFLEAISSNIKLNLNYYKLNYKSIINSFEPLDISSISYNYGLELRSGFKGLFNYHIGTKWTSSRVLAVKANSSTDNVSFLDLTFILKNKFDIKVQSERYFFGRLRDNNSYFFLDFDARYTAKKNKLLLSIVGKNLLNTKRFQTFSVSNIGTSTTEYRLLPRYMLFKIEYRF